MNRAKRVSYGDAPGLRFDCPGCGEAHVVPVRVGSKVPNAWEWNGSLERPTLSPSLLVTTGHHTPGFDKSKDPCWCTYDAEHPDEPSGFSCRTCHSFVREGRVEFLGDCTHSLAGKTIDLPLISESQDC